MLLLLLFCSTTLAVALDISDLRYVGTWESHRADVTHPPNLDDVLPNFRFTIPPIPDQLNRGVWAYRFHMWSRTPGEAFIATLPLVDEQSRCATVVECIEPLVEFLEENPTAPPMYVMLNWNFMAGTDYSNPNADAQASVLDPIVETYGMDRFYTVGDYLGDVYDSVRGAFNAKGFPTLEETRGKIILLTSGIQVFNSSSLTTDPLEHIFDPVRPYWYLHCADCAFTTELSKATALERTIFQYANYDFLADLILENETSTVNLCSLDNRGQVRADLATLNTTELLRMLFLLIDRDLNGEVTAEELDTIQVNLAQIGPGAKQQLFEGCRAGDDVITLPELEQCAAFFATQGIDLTNGLAAIPLEDAVEVLTASLRQPCHVSFTNFPIVIPGERQDFLVTTGSPACAPEIPALYCMKELAPRTNGGGSGSGTAFTVNFNNHGNTCGGN